MKVQVCRRGYVVRREISTHHKQSPNSVVDEDGSGCDEHAESNEAVELQLLAVNRCEFDSTAPF